MEVTIFSCLAVCMPVIIVLYSRRAVLVSDSDKYTSLVSQRIELESMVSTTHQTNCEPLSESLKFCICFFIYYLMRALRDFLVVN